ncbi:MAG: phosphoglycolate phosphatase [Pseudomonadota bacterium]
MTTAIKLIIFDLDGTLIDSVPDLAQALQRAFRDLALPAVKPAEVRQWVGNGAAKLIERALRHVGADVDAHQAALDGFLQHYSDCCADKTIAYPAVLETLDTLAKRGFTLAIATNKPRRFVAPILRHVGIDRYFSWIVGGDDVNHKKPDPDMLQRCMTQFEVSPKQTLMVGDSSNDIQAAHRANVLVAAVNYGYNHGQPIAAANPHWVLGSIADLLAGPEVEPQLLTPTGLLNHVP